MGNCDAKYVLRAENLLTALSPPNAAAQKVADMCKLVGDYSNDPYKFDRVVRLLQKNGHGVNAFFYNYERWMCLSSRRHECATFCPQTIALTGNWDYWDEGKQRMRQWLALHVPEIIR